MTLWQGEKTIAPTIRRKTRLSTVDAEVLGSLCGRAYLWTSRFNGHKV
ncbi:hypothetical protein IWX75_001428 [Arthrobacter sp. CAN_A6]